MFNNNSRGREFSIEQYLFSLYLPRHPLLLGQTLVGLLIVGGLALALTLLGCLLPGQVSLIASRHRDFVAPLQECTKS